MTNEQFQTPVFCPTAHALFDDFTEAVEAHFAATDKLISLARQHEAFAELKKSTDEARAESRAAVVPQNSTGKSIDVEARARLGMKFRSLRSHHLQALLQRTQLPQQSRRSN